MPFRATDAIGRDPKREDSNSHSGIAVPMVLVVEVLDNGEGLVAAAVSGGHAFTALSAPNRSPRNRSARAACLRTDLGLSIVKSIVVDQMGGQVGLASKQGTGTLFFAHIPVWCRRKSGSRTASDALAGRQTASGALRGLGGSTVTQKGSTAGSPSPSASALSGLPMRYPTEPHGSNSESSRLRRYDLGSDSAQDWVETLTSHSQRAAARTTPVGEVVKPLVSRAIAGQASDAAIVRVVVGPASGDSADLSAEAQGEAGCSSPLLCDRTAEVVREEESQVPCASESSGEGSSQTQQDRPASNACSEDGQMQQCAQDHSLPPAAGADGGVSASVVVAASTIPAVRRAGASQGATVLVNSDQECSEGGAALAPAAKFTVQVVPARQSLPAKPLAVLERRWQDLSAKGGVPGHAAAHSSGSQGADPESLAGSPPLPGTGKALSGTRLAADAGIASLTGSASHHRGAPPIGFRTPGSVIRGLKPRPEGVSRLHLRRGEAVAKGAAMSARTEASPNVSARHLSARCGAGTAKTSAVSSVGSVGGIDAMLEPPAELSPNVERSSGRSTLEAGSAETAVGMPEWRSHSVGAGRGGTAGAQPAVPM